VRRETGVQSAANEGSPLFSIFIMWGETLT
jgi:hypothetical protein